MRDGDVVALAVGRDGDVVRPVDVGRHDADRDDAVDGQAIAERPQPGDHVTRFAHHADAVPGVGALRRERRRRVSVAIRSRGVISEIKIIV